SQATGIVPPKWWTLAVSALASVLSVPWFRRLPRATAFLSASVLTLFATFLFGTQAFANYYYLVSGLLVLLIACLPPEARAGEGRVE
ncbi:MAG: hypothetical protein AAB728_04120, partial [Patescibacteria group bacterium]